MRSPLRIGAGEPGGLFSGEDNTPRRRWLALVGASAVMQFSYWPVVVALAASQAGDEAAGPAAALGLSIAPVTFLTLAFLSRHRRAPGAVLKAMGLFLLVSLPIILVPTMALVGVYAGYAAGGVLALRPMAVERPYRTRVLAVVAGGVYLWVIGLLGLAGLAQMSAAALPLAASGIADEILLGRAAARERHGDA
ncbi:MAG: hypothetical protein WD378_09965 [Egicoccus sp.]